MTTKETYLRNGKLNLFASGLNVGTSLLLAVLGVNFCFATALLAAFNWFVADMCFKEALKLENAPTE